MVERGPELGEHNDEILKDTLGLSQAEVDALTRRQAFAEGAFLDPAQYTDAQLNNLVVIAVSYCWITKEHPDPEGFPPPLAPVAAA